MNAIEDAIGFMSSKAGEANAISPDDYIGEDGLIYCGKCHTKKQTKLSIQGMNREFIVNCCCECKMAEYERAEQLKRQSEKKDRIKILRKNGINIGMHGWTFQNDNGSSQKIMGQAKKYVDNWEKMKHDNIGLCFFGNVGTGKTYAAACIANALIDREIRVVMTDFNVIINTIMQPGTKIDKNDYINDICSGELLIIDDFGAENQNDYTIPIIENVLNQRIETAKPLIITTNIHWKNISQPPQNTSFSRIYSRITQMTIPIQVDGIDKRRLSHEEKMKKAMEFFNE